MIKKIGVHQLKPGMYVHDMDCGWMEHPFLTDAFMVRGEKEIEKMVAYGIRELYIDSERGLDVADAPTQVEVERGITREMLGIVEPVKPVEPVSLHEELENARLVLTEANRIIARLMSGVRQGVRIEHDQISPVVRDMSESILRNKDALMSLCRIKEKDNYTFYHSISVGTLLMCFTRAFSLKPGEMELVGVGGMVHDIGKTMVPDRILNKAGELTSDEYATMQMHVRHGQNLLSEAKGISQISYDVMAQHHERHDGSGYPLKLKGAEMSLFGQMASIVDVYDAITSDRCYRKGMDPTVAIRKMFEWSKSHFDPELIRVFVRTIGIYPVGTLVLLESGRLAVVLNQDGRDMTRPLVRAILDVRKNYFIKPEDIDLSKPLGQGGGDRIISHETASKWNIDPHQFM